MKIDSILSKISYNKADEEFIKQHSYPSDSFSSFSTLWERVSTSLYLSERFLEKYYSKLIFKYTIANQQLSEEFLIKHFKDFNLIELAFHQSLSENFIENYLLPTVRKINDSSTLKGYAESIWNNLSTHYLSESFIEKHWKDVNWWSIFRYQTLSVRFIEKWINILSADPKVKELDLSLYWELIATRQKLSQKFIEKYLDKLGMQHVLANQKVSLKFLDKYWDKCIKVDKNLIFISAQNITCEFIEKHFESIKESSINCKSILLNVPLTEEFILKHRDEIDWNLISQNPKKLSEDFIEQYFIKEPKFCSAETIEKQLMLNKKDRKKQVLCINLIAQFGYKFSEEFLERNLNKFDPRYLFRAKNLLSAKFIDKHIDIFSKYIKEDNEFDIIDPAFLVDHKFPTWFIKKHANLLSISNMCNSGSMPVKLIRKNIKKIKWYKLYSSQHFSEKFIEENLKYLEEPEWIAIFSNQRLSAKFILKHLNKIKWDILSTSKYLTDEVIEKFFYNINWEAISEESKLTDKFIEKYSEFLNWNKISYSQKISKRFLLKYKDKIVERYFMENFRIPDKLKEYYVKHIKK